VFVHDLFCHFVTCNSKKQIKSKRFNDNDNRIRMNLTEQD